MKRTLLPALGLMLLVVLGGAAALIWRRGEPEPEYAGHPVSWWAQEYLENRCGGDKVRDAIRAGGDPAAAVFAKAFTQARPSKTASDNAYVDIRSKVPSPIQSALPRGPLRDEVSLKITTIALREQAIQLLGRIGPEAKGAIPVLREALTSDCSNVVQQALMAIEPPAPGPGVRPAQGSE